MPFSLSSSTTFRIHLTFDFAVRHRLQLPLLSKVRSSNSSDHPGKTWKCPPPPRSEFSLERAPIRVSAVRRRFLSTRMDTCWRRPIRPLLPRLSLPREHFGAVAITCTCQASMEAAAAKVMAVKVMTVPREVLVAAFLVTCEFGDTAHCHRPPLPRKSCWRPTFRSISGATHLGCR